MFSEIINDFWNSGFRSAIKYTLTGMIGIFIVVGIIIGVIYALGYFTDMDRNKTEDNE